jgi:hypothetical protein
MGVAEETFDYLAKRKNVNDGEFEYLMVRYIDIFM